MKIFSKKSTIPTLTSDEYLGAAFGTAQVAIGRAFESVCEEAGLPRKESLETYGRGAALTWMALLDASKLLFLLPGNYEVSKSLALSQGLTPILREELKGKEALDIPPNLIDASEIAELERFIQGQQTYIMRNYVPMDRISAAQAFSVDVAYKVGDVGMKRMMDSFTCYLCDTNRKWNADKVCSLERPHDWNEEQGEWKTSREDNQFFSFALGLISSTYLFDTVRYFATLDTPRASMAMDTETKGKQLVARMAYIYKKLNSVSN